MPRRLCDSQHKLHWFSVVQSSHMHIRGSPESQSRCFSVSFRRVRFVLMNRIISYVIIGLKADKTTTNVVKTPHPTPSRVIQHLLRILSHPPRLEPDTALTSMFDRFPGLSSRCILASGDRSSCSQDMSGLYTATWCNCAGLQKVMDALSCSVVNIASCGLLLFYPWQSHL